MQRLNVPAATLARMLPALQEDLQPGSRQSSFEKYSHRSHEYPLRPLDGRDSFDSDLGHSDPLLPTSEPPIRHGKCHCLWSGIVSWVKGPSPPRKYHIHPWFCDWQTAPGRLVDRYFQTKRSKVCLLLGVIAAWGEIFLSVVHSAVKGVNIAGYGNPVKLSCSASLW